MDESVVSCVCPTTTVEVLEVGIVDVVEASSLVVVVVLFVRVLPSVVLVEVV